MLCAGQLVSQLVGMLKWHDDGMTMTGWQDERMTLWWNDRMTGWWDNRMMGWPNDRMTEWLDDQWLEASQTIDRMVYFSCYIQIMKTINQWYPQNFQCYKLNRLSNECAVNCSVLVTNFVINKLNCCFVLLAAGFLILNHKNIILGDINKLKVSHSDSFYFRSYEFDSSKYSNFIHNLNIF